MELSLDVKVDWLPYSPHWILLLWEVQGSNQIMNNESMIFAASCLAVEFPPRQVWLVGPSYKRRISWQNREAAPASQCRPGPAWRSVPWNARKGRQVCQGETDEEHSGQLNLPHRLRGNIRWGLDCSATIPPSLPSDNFFDIIPMGFSACLVATLTITLALKTY